MMTMVMMTMLLVMMVMKAIDDYNNDADTDAVRIMDPGLLLVATSVLEY